MSLMMSDMRFGPSRPSIEHYRLRSSEEVYTKLLRLFSVYYVNDPVTRTNAHDFFEVCSECGTWVFQNTAEHVYSDDVVCPACLEEYYVYSEDRDAYVHQFDDPDAEVEEEVMRYNADPLDYLSFLHTAAEAKRAGRDSPKPLVYLGIELEVERDSRADRTINRDVTAAVEGIAICKHDGSLDNGFEVVSAPMTLAYHYGGADGKCPWDKFFNGPAKKLKSWLTDTCGIHVHISRNALSPMQLGKMMVFINSDINQRFIERIAGRTLNNWCEPSSNTTVQDVLKGSQQGKYVALNLNNERTVELRIFRGNTKKAGFFRCLDFAAALVEFTRTTSLINLKASDFITWMSEQRHAYPHLATWLVQIELMGADKHRINPAMMSDIRMSHEAPATSAIITVTA
jgi:hypothetical protein